MTVLQIVKGLIGEEDVNWGDSDTTFTRQTHTGGSTTIHYIDSKSIPANTLGSYVDDHLHTQNTDTGTTSTTFILNSGGTSVTLSVSGVTGSYTYTFPTTGSTRLIGEYDLLSTAKNYGASMVGVHDSGGYLSGTNVEDCLEELAIAVGVATEYRGYKRGFKLGYSSTSAVTISGGMWDHQGTTEQNVYTESQITFTLGAAGSNSGSTNLGVSEMHYIYIDDSAIVTSGSALLTATEFLNTTTAPAWSNIKHGWYNGNDRCIGSIRTNTSSEVIDFVINSNNYYQYTTDTLLTEYAAAAAPTTYTNLDLSSSMPVFSTTAKLYIAVTSMGSNYFFSVNGAGGMGSSIWLANGTYGTVDVYTDTSQVADWKGSAAATTSLSLVGYYIDEL